MTKKIYLFFFVLISFVTQSSSQEKRLHDRFQLEGSFATIFESDAGFNLNLNYTPPLPGVLDGILTIGGFWQWTFEADELLEDENVMKLGEEIRFQKPIGPFVPYIKFETAWIRFDNGKAIDKFGVGPGAGLNSWITHNFGLGAEVNTCFIFDRDEAPEKQITTFLLGPRIRL